MSSKNIIQVVVDEKTHKKIEKLAEENQWSKSLQARIMLREWIKSYESKNGDIEI